MLVAIYIIGYSVKLDVYRIWNLDYVQPLCCRSFSTAKILPNPKLEK